MRERDYYTIQTDGTTKYGEHFATYDVATADGTYSLGLRHIFSGSAQDSLTTLKQIMEDLDIVQKELGTSAVSSKIVSKLKNNILPDVVEGWSNMNDTEREQFTRMNNFFCGLHFVVGLADSAEATLKLWESTFEDDLPAGTNSSLSGTQRLTYPYSMQSKRITRNKLVAQLTFVHIFVTKALTQCR